MAYNGLVYKNKWYTVGEYPYLGGPDSPWELEGVCPVLLSVNTELAKENGLNFQIQPNPTANGFWVLFETDIRTDTRLNLVNLNGQVVGTQTINAPTNAPIYWDTQNMPSGVYCLQVIDKNNSICKKIVVTK